MSQAINAVAFAGWDVGVSSAAHAGWLEGGVVIPPEPERELTGDAFGAEARYRDELFWQEDDEIISLIIALHERR